jgi:hypothetical protein
VHQPPDDVSDLCNGHTDLVEVGWGGLEGCGVTSEWRGAESPTASDIVWRREGLAGR